MPAGARELRNPYTGQLQLVYDLQTASKLKNTQQAQSLGKPVSQLLDITSPDVDTVP